MTPPNRRFTGVAVAPGLGLSDRALKALEDLSATPPVQLGPWPPAAPLPGAQALIAGWQHHIDEASLAALPDLRYIGLRATSTDRVDTQALARRGVELAGITHYGDNSTAEYVLSALLRELRITLPGRPAREARGRRLGLIGFGAVAQLVARGASALGMDVVYHAPSGPRQTSTPARHVSLADALGTSDVVSVHTPARTHVLGPRELELLGPDSVLLVTTLGLPFTLRDFRAFWPRDSRRAVFDLVAAHDDATALAAIPGCTVDPVYAARSEESVREAEDQLVRAARGHLSVPKEAHP